MLTRGVYTGCRSKKKRVYTGHWVVINDPGKLSKVLSFRLEACMKRTIDKKSSLY